MELNQKNIIIFGAGISGLAMAKFCQQQGAHIIITDQRHEVSQEYSGFHLKLGGHPDIPADTDLILLSPGVPHTLPVIKQAQNQGIPVWGEIELASRYINKPIVAITGTNGKTTVTTMVSQMLQHSGLRVFTGGNIGTPLINYIKAEPVDLVVVEISSFQLDTIHLFKPQIAVLLNITSDHLDRYPDFDAYIKSKLRIFENQTSADTAILNRNDAVIKAAQPDLIGKSFCLEEDGINFINLRLPGLHNLENAKMAVMAALAAGAKKEAVQEVIDSFKGLPHRIEFRGSVKGVSFYNDSKATNPDAVVRALESFQNQPLILIMGGRNKGFNFKKLQDQIRKVKTLIVMGESAEELAQVFAGVAPIKVNSMQTAVQTAFQAALPNDVVLLSPGCASFDLYSGYAARGADFCKLVKEL